MKLDELFDKIFDLIFAIMAIIFLVIVVSLAVGALTLVVAQIPLYMYEEGMVIQGTVYVFLLSLTIIPGIDWWNNR